MDQQFSLWSFSIFGMKINNELMRLPSDFISLFVENWSYNSHNENC